MILFRQRMRRIIRECIAAQLEYEEGHEVRVVERLKADARHLRLPERPGAMARHDRVVAVEQRVAARLGRCPRGLAPMVQAELSHA